MPQFFVREKANWRYYFSCKKSSTNSQIWWLDGFL